VSVIKALLSADLLTRLYLIICPEIVLICPSSSAVASGCSTTACRPRNGRSFSRRPASSANSANSANSA
jgi:hypothetical protein